MSCSPGLRSPGLNPRPWASLPAGPHPASSQTSGFVTPALTFSQKGPGGGADLGEVWGGTPRGGAQTAGWADSLQGIIKGGSITHRPQSQQDWFFPPGFMTLKILALLRRVSLGTLLCGKCGLPPRTLRAGATRQLSYASLPGPPGERAAPPPCPPPRGQATPRPPALPLQLALRPVSSLRDSSSPRSTQTKRTDVWRLQKPPCSRWQICRVLPSPSPGLTVLCTSSTLTGPDTLTQAAGTPLEGRPVCPVALQSTFTERLL